ncbi:hypothetical protein EBS43_00655 [bacterium]|nr:hypothetical protein [bacterium]
MSICWLGADGVLYANVHIQSELLVDELVAPSVETQKLPMVPDPSPSMLSKDVKVLSGMTRVMRNAP